MTAIKTTMGPLEWTMLVALSLVWGGSFFFVGVAVHDLPTMTIVLCRVGLAALLLIAVVYALGKRMLLGGSIWLAFFAMGLLNNVIPFCLIVWGQGYIASGLASILNAATPLFTVLVAHGLTQDERLTSPRLLGVLAGLLGVLIMVGFDAVAELGAQTLAQMAILGAAISYAFAGVFGRRFRNLGVSPMQTAAGQVTASSLILLPLVLVHDRPWALPMPGTASLMSLIGLAILSTALAYVLYFQILARAGATNLVLVTFLVPVSAILLGVGILQEALLPQHLAGMFMIGLGLVVIDGRPLRWLRRR